MSNPSPGAKDSGPRQTTYADIARKSSELAQHFFAMMANRSKSAVADELGIAQAFSTAGARLLADPMRLATAQMRMWQDYAALWRQSMLRMLGGHPQPVAAPAPTDRRFKDPDWDNCFLFDYIKQSYLIAARHLHALYAGIGGLDPQTAKKVDFYTRQYIDAIAPTNFALTNPQVLREIAASGGQNLLNGLENLLEDLAGSGDTALRVKMTDRAAFRLGEDIAATPGKVVYQNELLQLIQYAPLGEQVYERPLLIIPPWINKFYILDLRERNSFIRWAVEQGHTVFVISWVNPDERLAGKRFDDYMTEGALAALDAVTRATGVKDPNVIGYCLGGTLLASTLGYLAAKKEKRVHSATFFVSMIDFENPGELGVFIDEHQVSALEARMRARGFLAGAEMGTTFNMLRANDLIWSFVVNNYLLGREAPPFDLLYWNADSTRMPAAMHSFYLRKLYLENKLKTPAALELAGVPIDLTRVDVPAYFVSTIEDHIAPWKSTYAGARLLQGETRFVLGGSGHIAGIINPPAANKYCYWSNDALPDTPDQWLAGAVKEPGSWWTDWAKWAAAHGGRKVAARVPGEGLEVIEDAPGSYVKVQSEPADGNASRRAASIAGTKA